MVFTKSNLLHFSFFCLWGWMVDLCQICLGYISFHFFIALYKVILKKYRIRQNTSGSNFLIPLKISNLQNVKTKGKWAHLAFLQAPNYTQRNSWTSFKNSANNRAAYIPVSHKVYLQLHFTSAFHFATSSVSAPLVLFFLVNTKMQTCGSKCRLTTFTVRKLTHGNWT